jgi:hypothetical protein
MAGQVNYIKVARIDGDGNDLTDTLQDLTQITIPYSSGNVIYEVINITRYSTYFMYYVENPSINFADRDDIEYDFTGSIVTGELDEISNRAQIPITTVENDPLKLFDSTIQAYKINTLAQKDIYVDFSGSVWIQKNPGSADVNIGVAVGIPGNPPGTIYSVDSTGVSGGSVYRSFHISASIPQSELNNRIGQYIFPYFDAFGPGNPPPFIRFDAARPTEFVLTSSAPLGTGLETIPEPYFTQNFDRAYDCQPLFNNVSRYATNPFLQDLDYQTSQTVPINIQAIVSGSATKGTVPQSHYTQLASTLIRYDGSKSTSQFLNKWTPGDSGGYGKLPNIDSTQVYVAYCDSITSSIQERMDTSAAHVKYLIKDDGTIVTPNVTPNSLGIIQDNFVSQERLELNSQDVGTGGGATSFREIVRGGSRIEPIIYNQSGSYLINTPMRFTDSILLTDNSLFGGVVGDYQAELGTDTRYGPAGYGTGLTTSPYTKVKFYHIKSSGSALANGDVTEGGFDYRINNGVITEGLNLNFTWEVDFIASPGPYPAGPLQEGVIGLRVYNETTGQFIGDEYFNDEIPASYPTWKFSISGATSIFNLDANTGDVYSIRLRVVGSPSGTDAGLALFKIGIFSLIFIPTKWIIYQQPTPTSTINTEGLFNKVPDAYTSSYQGIYVTASEFVSAYGTPGIQQSSSVDSGFIPITTDLEFLPGDEFRFMGREDKSFMIEKVEQNKFPFTDTSASLMIYLDGRVNPDDSILNVNQFLVRRYVDEASSIIFKGDKPLGSLGPYIVSPEFISSDLDKDVDTFIADLTERNLLP